MMNEIAKNIAAILANISAINIINEIASTVVGLLANNVNNILYIANIFS